MKVFFGFIRFLVVGVLLLIVLFISWALGSLIWIIFWHEARPIPKSSEELFAPLTEAQTQCINQVVGKGQIIQIELQDDLNFIGIGYINEEGLYAAMLDLGDMGKCKIEFQMQQVPAPLKDVFGNEIEPYFHKIQRIELTGDEKPDIYLWFDEYGTYRDGGARHKFYIKQSDGSYRDSSLFTGIMCRGWSAIEFIELVNENRPKILVINDMRCDWRGPGKHGTSYYELVINNDGVQPINSWREEGTRPEFWYKP
jgi:hypothetical protein